MAHANELAYLARFLKDYPSNTWLQSLDGQPVLNCGIIPKGLDYASLFPDRTLVGLDQQPGAGVDLVCDLAGRAYELDDRRFAAVLCCSVLEHCTKPWIAAANLERVLSPQGLIYVTVPWIWRTHNHPDDYWRMSHKGIKLLFPSIVWKRIAYFSQAPNEEVPQDKSSDRPWRKWEKGGRVYLSSQMVCMIGRKS